MADIDFATTLQEPDLYLTDLAALNRIYQVAKKVAELFNTIPKDRETTYFPTKLLRELAEVVEEGEGK